MHILMLVVFGLIGSDGLRRDRRMINAGGRHVDGARIFIWCWLLASLLNGAVGVFAANIALINELPPSSRSSAFLPP